MTVSIRTEHPNALTVHLVMVDSAGSAITGYTFRWNEAGKIKQARLALARKARQWGYTVQ